MTMFQFLRREFLYVFGAFGALLILWWKGHAFVLGQHISGYRWQDYFFNAWIIRLQESQLYDPFRNPLHGYLLSSLGDAINSYIHAAILISSLSVTLSILLIVLDKLYPLYILTSPKVVKVFLFSSLSVCHSELLVSLHLL